MEETCVVHVHRLDEESVVMEHLTRDFVLQDKSDPTIVTQGGFFRLTFVKDPAAAAQVRSGARPLIPPAKGADGKGQIKRLFSIK